MRNIVIPDSVIVVKEDEMGGACGTYGGLGKCIQDLIRYDVI
jgi:hypothetical protein